MYIFTSQNIFSDIFMQMQHLSKNVQIQLQDGGKNKKNVTKPESFQQVIPSMCQC